jgi:L-asparaginase/Glu-tRNA(Gln) amidotransferase subunit D
MVKKSQRPANCRDLTIGRPPIINNKNTEDGMKKKILLIHTGGTIGMTRDSQKFRPSPNLKWKFLLSWTALN